MRFAEDIDQKNQTLVEHLSELRVSLIRSVIGIIVGSIACYFYSEDLFNFIRSPILPYLQNGGLVFTAPMDKFMAHFKVAIFSGAILTSPFWFYQIWRFIAPGLYKRERFYALGFISSAVVLFLGGVMICYYAVLPVTFQFLLAFGGTVDKPMITIDEYLSFFMMIHLGFGLAFELPLVLVVLGILGVVSQDFLRDKRRYAIVLMSIFAAIVTPSPDAITMLMMLVPLALLYEVAVILVGIFEKKAATTN
ncbi:MAG: twin-arginine translocase subunit TatC [Pseudomonadota bacterium]|jgi:sec-independent protein translocase protein TatC